MLVLAHLRTEKNNIPKECTLRRYDHPKNLHLAMSAKQGQQPYLLHKVTQNEPAPKKKTTGHASYYQGPVYYSYTWILNRYSPYSKWPKMKIHIGFTGFCCSPLFFVKLELAHTNMALGPWAGWMPGWNHKDGTCLSWFVRTVRWWAVLRPKWFFEICRISNYPYHPCRVYLPKMWLICMVNVSKYVPYMDAMG